VTSLGTPKNKNKEINKEINKTAPREARKETDFCAGEKRE
jgi:hypothetical protein